MLCPSVWVHAKSDGVCRTKMYDDKNQTRIHKEEDDRNLVTIPKGTCPQTRAADETVWPAEENNSLPSSSDSNYSVCALLPTASSSAEGQIVRLYCGYNSTIHIRYKHTT